MGIASSSLAYATSFIYLNGMGKPRRKRKIKVRVQQSPKLVHKNDATRVEKAHEGKVLKRVSGRPPADVGPTFRLRIRRKK